MTITYRLFLLGYKIYYEYVLQPGVILIPDGRLGIQNGSQYCKILYGFQS